MGLFRKKPSKEYVDEWNFTVKCLDDLSQIRQTATLDELIGLQINNLDEYMPWRKEHPTMNPRAFFYRPGAPDISEARKAYEDIALMTHEAKDLLEKKERREKAKREYEKKHPSLSDVTADEMNAAVMDIAVYQQTHLITQSDFPHIINYIKWKRINPGKNVNNTPLDIIKREIDIM